MHSGSRGAAFGCLVAASSLSILFVSHAQEGSDSKPAQQLLQLPTFDLDAPASREKSGAASDDAPESYVGAVPIQRTGPIYPPELLAAGREGWVALSFIISPEGRVTDVMVEDSSGIRSLETAALKAVQTWRYQPATLNGTPIAQTMTRDVIRFETESDGVRGARSSFASKYKKTAELIQKHDLEHARAMLDELESAGRLNLYEDAWFWWLKYTYMEAAGDASVEERRDTLHRALGYKVEYLPPDFFVVASVRLFKLETAASNFSGALEAVDRLKSSKTATSAKDYPEAVAALDAASVSIRTLVNGDSTLKVDGKIGNHDYWVHGLLRRSFSIVDIHGRLDVVEIRCERASTRYPAAGTAHKWEVPQSWGSCGAYVKGEPGTTFVVYEYPKKS